MADMHAPLKPAQGYFASLGWESLDGKDVFVGHAVFDAPPKWPVNVVWDQTPMVFTSAAAPSQDAEKIKALEARYDQGRRDVLNAILALNPKAEALLAGLHEREPNPLGQMPFDVAVWVTEVADQLGIQPKDEDRAVLAGSAS